MDHKYLQFVLPIPNSASYFRRPAYMKTGHNVRHVECSTVLRHFVLSVPYMVSNFRRPAYMKTGNNIRHAVVNRINILIRTYIKIPISLRINMLVYCNTILTLKITNI